MKLYAISYDDQTVLREFAEKQGIPFPLLSDLDSAVIRNYGILNDRIGEDDGFLWGVPYPGVYVTDERGVVVAKFFHDTYKKRDSPETLIDAALGRVSLHDDAPRVRSESGDVRITAAIHGGRGTIRQGIVRKVVVRFELRAGLHLYGEPAPEGMIPTMVMVVGPPGLVVGDPVFPPTTMLPVPGLDVELCVFGESFDVVIPIHAVGELASETRPLDLDSIPIDIAIRYQACDNDQCLLPRSEKLRIEVPLDVIDIPSISTHQGHGQREARFDGTPHLRRLLRRSIRRSPLGFLRFIAKNLRLELAAWRRRRSRSARP